MAPLPLPLTTHQVAATPQPVASIQRTPREVTAVLRSAA